MKLAILSLLLLGVSLFAEDIKTADGAEYKSVTVLRSAGAFAFIETDSGVVKLAIASLPESFRTAHALALPPTPQPTPRIVRSTPEPVDKDLSRIHGRILQVLREGLLVECEQSHGGPAVSGLGRVGGGGHTQIEIDPNDQNRAEEIYGIFLLVEHPKAKSKVDDDRIDVDARQLGVFQFTDTTGAQRTVKKFKTVKALE